MPERTILLIDYDPTSIEGTRESLTQAGFRVEVANDGVAGLEAFRRLKPDLVLIEPMVPKKHGFQVCQEIKQSPDGRATPVLITTAFYKSRRHRSEAKEHYGCDEYLLKPITRELLLSTCQKFLVDLQKPPLPPEGPSSASDLPAAAEGLPALEDLTDDEIMARLDSMILEESDDRDLPAAEPPAPRGAAPTGPSGGMPAKRDASAPKEAAAGSRRLERPPVSKPPGPGGPRAKPARPSAPRPAEPSPPDGGRRTAPSKPGSRGASRPGPPARKTKTPRPAAPRAAPSPRGKGTPLVWAGVGGVALVLGGLGLLWALRGDAGARIAPARAVSPPAMGSMTVPAAALFEEPGDGAGPPSSGPEAVPAEAGLAGEEAPSEDAAALPTGVSHAGAKPGRSASAPGAPAGGTVRSRGAAPTGAVSDAGAPSAGRSLAGGSPGRRTPAAAKESSSPPTPPGETAPAQPVDGAGPREEASAPDRVEEVSVAAAVPEAETASTEEPAGTPTPAADAEEPPTAAAGPAAPRARRGDLVEVADRAPSPLDKPLPRYPPIARKLRQQGTVVLRLLVDETGRVADVEVVSGVEGKVLDRAAVDAARNWTYEPAVKDEVPVKTWILESVSFKL